jgi:hypothetical protein
MHAKLNPYVDFEGWSTPAGLQTATMTIGAFCERLHCMAGRSLEWAGWKHPCMSAGHGELGSVLEVVLAPTI